MLSLKLNKKSIKRALKLAQACPHHLAYCCEEFACHFYGKRIYESCELNMTRPFYCTFLFPSHHILRNKLDHSLYCFLSLPETFLIDPGSLVLLPTTLCQFCLMSCNTAF